MRDIFEVLREKEIQLSKLEAQIEALRVAAGIMADDGTPLSSLEEPAARKGPVPAPALNADAEPKAVTSGSNGHKLWP
jgi:hypothetical protein